MKFSERDYKNFKNDEDWKYVADQIENHARAIGYLLAELEVNFPPTYCGAWGGGFWAINPETRRPEIYTGHEDNDE